jgi:hypothetical protein
MELVARRIEVTLHGQMNFLRNVLCDEHLLANVPKPVVAVEEETQVNEYRDASNSAAQMKSPWFGDL